MQSNIAVIMQQLLKLANEVDVDSLSNVMEEFVEVFASELTPFAVELTKQLVCYNLVSILLPPLTNPLTIFREIHIFESFKMSLTRVQAPLTMMLVITLTIKALPPSGFYRPLVP
jgi:hypothetical protein